jgi:hypothetical protein
VRSIPATSGALGHDMALALAAVLLAGGLSCGLPAPVGLALRCRLVLGPKSRAERPAPPYSSETGVTSPTIAQKVSVPGDRIA